MIIIERIVTLFAVSNLLVVGLPEPRQINLTPTNPPILATLKATETIGQTLSIRITFPSQILNP